MDLSRQVAWLNQTKSGTPRGVRHNGEAVQVLEEQVGKHARYCFTYERQPIRWQISNTAWLNAAKKAGIMGLRFYDLRHTLAS